MLLLESEGNEPNKFLRNQAKGKSTQIKFCLGPQGAEKTSSAHKAYAMKLRDKSLLFCELYRMREGKQPQRLIWFTRL